jgi:hypothetical protein
MDTNHVATHGLNYSSHMSPYSGTLLPAQPTTAIADTGCTGHFLQIDDHAQHRQPTSTGIIVQMPNHSRIQATHTSQINIPDLPSKACEAHLFPNLAHALLSLASCATTDAPQASTKSMSRFLTATPSSSQDIAILIPTCGKCPSNQLY